MFALSPKFGAQKIKIKIYLENDRPPSLIITKLEIVNGTSGKIILLQVKSYAIHTECVLIAFRTLTRRLFQRPLRKF